MGLVITRRIGESFTMTWPSGEKRSLELKPGRLLLVSDESGKHIGRVFLPDVIGVPGSPEIMMMEIEPSRSGGGQQAIHLVGSTGVRVLRDNAKNTQEKVR